GPEGGARDGGRRRPFQQELGQLLAALDHLAPPRPAEEARDLREKIEGALGRRAAEARQPAQSRQQQVPPLPEGADHRLDTGLGTLEGLDGGYLGEGGGVG